MRADLQNAKTSIPSILGSKIRTIQTLRGSSGKRLPLGALQRSIVSWDWWIASDDKEETMDRLQKSMSGSQTKVMQSLRTIVLPVNGHIDVNVPLVDLQNRPRNLWPNWVKTKVKRRVEEPKKARTWDRTGGRPWRKIWMSPSLGEPPLTGHNQALQQHNKTYLFFRSWMEFWQYTTLFHSKEPLLQTKSLTAPHVLDMGFGVYVQCSCRSHRVHGLIHRYLCRPSKHCTFISSVIFWVSKAKKGKKTWNFERFRCIFSEVRNGNFPLNLLLQSPGLDKANLELGEVCFFNPKSRCVCDCFVHAHLFDVMVESLQIRCEGHET